MSYPVADRSTDLPFCSQFRLGHYCRFPVLPLYGSARALSRARVGMRALSPDRESPPMANPPVTPEVHQSLDVHRNFPTQVAFSDTLPDFTAKGIELSVCQVTNRHIRADPGRIAYLERAGPADTEDVHQGDPCVFPVGNIDSSNTCHSDLLSLLSQVRTRESAPRPSALPLLVPRILANDAHRSLAADYLAVPAQSFDRRSNLHTECPRCIIVVRPFGHIPSSWPFSVIPRIGATSNAIAPAT